MSLDIAFDNSYAALPRQLFVAQDPTPVAEPSLLALNRELAEDLGLDPEELAAADGVAMLAGNRVPANAEPLAQAYAGHQFGNWVPQLGDGRAILLGEVINGSGQRHDIVLKGAGRTPFSRSGDGRAWIGPVLREYIISEAMAGFGVPTTRALAAVATGERVQRERGFPGAILTRVATSHIRVGTFQYFAARGDTEALQALVAHVIARHYPEAETPLDLLKSVIAAQAELIAHWISLGFVHGVMNTDNMTISGETIDYGPCAFLDRYEPGKVFSSIDHFGRYAYDKQPQIAAWNLAQLATSLLPLMKDRDRAITDFTDAVHGFVPLYEAAWQRRFSEKLGLETAQDGDRELIASLLKSMQDGHADFTNTFRGLSDETSRNWFEDSTAFDQWIPLWQDRLAQEGATADSRSAALNRANPAYIPRNHRVEEAIAAALSGDLAPFHRMVSVLSHPFDTQPEHQQLATPPKPTEEVRQTFCGT